MRETLLQKFSCKLWFYWIVGGINCQPEYVGRKQEKKRSHKSFLMFSGCIFMGLLVGSYINIMGSNKKKYRNKILTLSPVW